MIIKKEISFEDEITNEIGIVVTQECEECGECFRVLYRYDGTMDYIDEPCDCCAEFRPINGPSISEWIEQIKTKKIN